MVYTIFAMTLYLIPPQGSAADSNAASRHTPGDTGR